MPDNLAKVKELRELTGAGIQDCKTALSENNLILKSLLSIYVKKELQKRPKNHQEMQQRVWQ